MMQETLTLLARMQAQIAAIQLDLLEYQETPSLLLRQAAAAKAIEANASALGDTLRGWAGDLALEEEGGRALEPLTAEEDDG